MPSLFLLAPGDRCHPQDPEPPRTEAAVVTASVCVLCPAVHQTTQARPADHGGGPGGGEEGAMDVRRGDGPKDLRSWSHTPAVTLTPETPGGIRWVGVLVISSRVAPVSSACLSLERTAQASEVEPRWSLSPRAQNGGMPAYQVMPRGVAPPGQVLASQGLSRQ